MKAIAIALLLVMLCAGAAFSAEGYIGAWADASHSVYVVYYSGSMTQFETWVWVASPQRGVQAAEFLISYPSNVIPSVVTANPAIAVSLGDVLTGISVAFGECQRSWAWTHHQTCYLMTREVGFVRVLERPGIGLQFASCEMGYPLYPLIRWSSILLNCSVATESSSWGAIKGLF